MNIKKIGLFIGVFIVGLIVLKIVMNLLIPFLILAVILGACGYGIYRFWHFAKKDEEVQSAIKDTRSLMKKLIDFLNEKLK